MATDSVIPRLEDGRYHIGPVACEGCALCAAACESRAISMQAAVTGRLITYQGDGRFFSTASLRMGSGNSGKLVSALKKKLTEYEASGHYAVIDGSPGIGCPVIASVSGVTLVLIVAEPTLWGMSDMERILKTAFQLRAQCAVCINKSDVNEFIANEIEAFCQKAEVPFAGRVPFDKNVVEAVSAGVTIVDRGGIAAHAIEALYRQVSDLIQKREAAE